MKIALLGSNGQLGSDLRESLASHDVVPLTRADFDVTDHAAARRTLLEITPGMIINTTAYHRVDDCEERPGLAYSVNVLAVINLARIANEAGAQFMQFSTDYVFDGKADHPYTESSPALPLSIYGNSRLAAEFVVRSIARRFILIRTCGLYGCAGSRGKGGNFVEIMLTKARAGEAIRVVNDQVLTPTYTADLAKQIALLIDSGEMGVFHITNEGACSWYQFAQTIFDMSGVKANLTPATSETYNAPAVRPKYSVLENARLKDLGLNRMRHWREALAAYLDDMKSRRG